MDSVTQAVNNVEQTLLVLQDENREMRLSLVVGHVSGCGAELGVGLDDLVDSLQEVLLCGDLPACPDGKHTRLRAHAADLGA